MRPIFTADDISDVGKRYAELCPKRAIADATDGIESSDLIHLLLGQLGIAVCFPSTGSSMFDGVLPVRRDGIPSQVGEVIVGSVPITMATLMVGGAGAKKRNQDQSVDRECLAMSAFAEVHPGITVNQTGGGEFENSGVLASARMASVSKPGSHPSMGGNFVEPIVARRGFPDLGHRPSLKGNAPSADQFAAVTHADSPRALG
jgi:hypothetical protein